MNILSKKEIAYYVRHCSMISPFVSNVVRKPGHLSYGADDCAYDVRIQDEVVMFKGNTELVVDPKNFNDACCEKITGNVIVMPPNSFMLAYTIESFKIPKEVFVLCMGKSTYARCGIVVNPTCINPGQEGHLVIELSNTSPLPVKIYTGENDGICTLVFFKVPEGDGYQGRFQQQDGIRFPTKL